MMNRMGRSALVRATSCLENQTAGNAINRQRDKTPSCLVPLNVSLLHVVGNVEHLEG